MGLINIALTLVAVVAFTYLVFLGVKVLTGAADLEEVKKSIATTFVGLLIIISSYSFVNTILEKVPQSETLTETSSNSDF
ncbi:MAG: hypothetical protein U9Q15_05055 [Patescibacteria group bacterium]|nr:hypothetical protein [Patescibacteria group bacterium]